MNSGEDEEWKWKTMAPGETELELHLPKDVVGEMEGEVTLVWKRRRDEWVRWVVVAESAVLRGMGIKKERGLYAWGSFARGEAVGVYGGRVVAEFRE